MVYTYLSMSLFIFFFFPSRSRKRRWRGVWGAGRCVKETPGTKTLRKSGSVPATAVPAKIQAYIAKEYPGETITQLTRSQKGYVVGLSDGETIPFDQNGKPAKMKHGH